MEVSIIVNHYRSPKALKLTLEYVLQWQREYEVRNGDATTEIIVTDSATVPETREMMQLYFPSVVFLEEKENIGFGKSMNRALRIASGDVLFMMNADLVIPQPQELDNLIRYIKNNKDVGVVAPSLRNFDNTLQYSAFQFYTPLVVLLRRTALGKTEFGKKRLREFLLIDAIGDLKQPLSVDWVMGSALATTKEHLARVGLFDERFFMYMEDVDLCRRFKLNGLKVVYYPLSIMYHFHGKASGSKNPFAMLWNRYTYIHFLSAVKYFLKYYNVRNDALRARAPQTTRASLIPEQNPESTEDLPQRHATIAEPSHDAQSPRSSVMFF